MDNDQACTAVDQGAAPERMKGTWIRDGAGRWEAMGADTGAWGCLGRVCVFVPLFFVEDIEGGLRVSLCVMANHEPANASLWSRAGRSGRRQRGELPSKVPVPSAAALSQCFWLLLTLSCTFCEGRTLRKMLRVLKGSCTHDPWIGMELGCLQYSQYAQFRIEAHVLA